MLSPEDAAALVHASRLFDERWYAGLVGRDFGSRAEAVAHWVAEPGDASPHPLFEPLWLYPGERWREHAPDPLSFYLSRPGARGRSPHPDYLLDELGPLEDWLAAGHEPDELLTPPVPREFRGDVWVELGTLHFPTEVRHLRRLLRLDVNVLLQPALPAGRRRVLERLAAPHPRVLVADDCPSRISVRVGYGVSLPSWPWLPQLVAALDDESVETAHALSLADDFTVQGPLLVGHTVSAIEKLDGMTLPWGVGPVSASRRATPQRLRTVLATSSWLPGTVDDDQSDEPEWAALLEATTRVTPVDGVPTLTWSIDIAAGAAPIGRTWGDWHFARSLADALERLGQRVEIDHPETRARATRRGTDVVLTLRGLERVAPYEGAVNLLWVISHPDDVTAAELAEFDTAYAAGTAWAEHHGVTPLLQCTDTTRFHPGVGEAAPEGRALFVGNARGGPRPVVAAAHDAGLDLDVIGLGWPVHGITPSADRISNADLPRAYASAGVVLNDHHADMAAQGFVSNRVFDVLAVGGRLLTDPVVGLAETLGTDVPTWSTPDDLARLARPPYDAWPGPDERLALARRIVAEHSFDARAATLLAEARRHLGGT